MNLSAPDHLLAGAVALGAGFVNAIAGGGTVLTFPALVALGVPAVGANITNTVALCPGYFGGTFAQADALREQRRRLAPIAAVAAAGGLAGSVLLVSTSERVFEALIPWLLLAACALLGFQGSIRRLLPAARAAGSGRAGAAPAAQAGRAGPGLLAGLFAASVYGGYFGAGLGIITLAVLGLFLTEPLDRLNALKQGIAFVTNVVAALFFLGSDRVVWSLAAVMAPASLVGGHLGGKAVSRINPRALRAGVVAIGVLVALRYLLF